MNTLKIAAACLLDAQQRLLLVRKRGTQAWMLPGGKQESGEAPLAAVCRELDEELGLRLDGSTLAVLGRFQAAAANEADTQVDADIFQGRINETVIPAAEIAELRWLERHGQWPETLAPLLRTRILPVLWPVSE